MEVNLSAGDGYQIPARTRWALFALALAAVPALNPAAHGQTRGPVERSARPGKSLGVVDVGTRIATDEGALVIYDAPRAEGEPPGQSGYLAYWKDFAAHEVYVYGRVIEKRSDLVHALLWLQRDFGVDPRTLAERLFGDAPDVPNVDALTSDGTRMWSWATRGNVMMIAGLWPPEEVDAAGGTVATGHVIGLPGCFPCAAAAGGDGGTVVPPSADVYEAAVLLVCACCGGPECPDCDDSNLCTSDWCEVECNTAWCAHGGRSCNDGNKCTTDGCNSQSGCYHTPKNCNDGNVCTADSCNGSTGACVNNRYCSNGICCPSGTGFFCAPAGGMCCYNPDHPCNTGETCCGAGCCASTSFCCEGQACCPNGWNCRNGQCCEGAWCGDTCCGVDDGCCGNGCCPPESPLCCDAEVVLCCGPEQMCCGGGCCSADSTCCGGYCCDAEHHCCADGVTCCVDGQECCDGQCCPEDYHCCGEPGVCCPPGGSCCDGACCGGPCCEATGECCPAGGSCCNNECCAGQCCDGSCCPGGPLCCGDGCCAAGTECCNPQPQLCCPAGGVCCSDPDHCCNMGETCCGSSCCLAGMFCCPDGITCCATGSECCAGDCCGGVATAGAAEVCCVDMCCAEPYVCCNGQCEAKGACCFFDTGSCSELTSLCCQQQGGTYQGNGTTCSPADLCRPKCENCHAVDVTFNECGHYTDDPSEPCDESRCIVNTMLTNSCDSFPHRKGPEKCNTYDSGVPGEVVQDLYDLPIPMICETSHPGGFHLWRKTYRGCGTDCIEKPWEVRCDTGSCAAAGPPIFHDDRGEIHGCGCP